MLALKFDSIFYNFMNEMNFVNWNGETGDRANGHTLLFHVVKCSTHTPTIYKTEKYLVNIFIDHLTCNAN